MIGLIIFNYRKCLMSLRQSNLICCFDSNFYINCLNKKVSLSKVVIDELHVKEFTLKLWVSCSSSATLLTPAHFTVCSFLVCVKSFNMIIVVKHIW